MKSYGCSSYQCDVMSKDMSDTTNLAVADIFRFSFILLGY